MWAGVVVSTAAFHARVRGLFPGLSGLKGTKLFFPHPISLVGSISIVGSVLGLRPPGFKFRILCLDGIIISPFPRGSPGPI